VRTLRLYAPVLVLLALAALQAVGANLADVGLLALASAVFVHIRAEAER
jgi:hypothetical protein